MLSTKAKGGDVPHARSEPTGEDALAQSILAAVRGVRFGSIEIVIHDARVVQIIRTEKLRVER